MGDHALLLALQAWAKPRSRPSSRRSSTFPSPEPSRPVLQKKLDFSGILSGIAPSPGLLIDEIHRLLPDVEEMLYSAPSQISIPDILIGTGPGARTHSIPLQNFTAIPATTRQGLGQRTHARTLRSGAAPESLRRCRVEDHRRGARACSTPPVDDGVPRDCPACARYTAYRQSSAAPCARLCRSACAGAHHQDRGADRR